MNRLFIIFFTIIVACKVDAGIFLPIDDKEHSFFYKQLNRSEYLYHSSYDYFKAPYFIADSLIDLSSFKFLRKKYDNNINLILSVNDRISIKENHTTTSLEKLKAKLFASPFKNVYIYSSILLDEEKAEDPAYTGKKWRGLAGGVDQSFVAYNSKSFTAIGGRFKSYWGIEKSLLLSSEQSLDGISYSIRWKKLTLSYQLAKLNQLGVTLGSLFYENRYFAGHRLDLALTDNLRVGLFESVIFGGYGRTIEFNYVNPILFFHSDQLNDNTNDNTFLGFDFSYYRNKTKFYGQLLIDDMQIEKKSQGDQEPNEIGLIIGVYQTEILEETDFELSYTRITNRTYNQAFERNRYTENNRSLGFYNSNDFDLISGEVTRWFNEKTTISLQASHRRQGEGFISSEWTEPWLDIDGEYTEKFPTGVVEKTTDIQLGFESFLLDNFFISTNGGYTSVTHESHIASVSTNSFYLDLYITAYLFSKL